MKMKIDLAYLYRRLGANIELAKIFEVLTYSLMILICASILWILSKIILNLFFQKVSSNTKSKFDDLMIKNNIHTKNNCILPSSSFIESIFR